MKLDLVKLPQYNQQVTQNNVQQKQIVKTASSPRLIQHNQ
jgi:hypothetical protein